MSSFHIAKQFDIHCTADESDISEVSSTVKMVVPQTLLCKNMRT